MIAVGTPSGEDGSADLQYVLAAARNIAKCMTAYKVIVDKSTVPVGTADKIKQAVQEEHNKRGIITLECRGRGQPHLEKRATAKNNRPLWQHNLKGKLALWGIPFKPGTGDMRDALSRVVMEELWAKDATVTAHDPVAMKETHTSMASALICAMQRHRWMLFRMQMH